MEPRVGNKKSLDKVMTAKEAVRRFVRDGDTTLTGLQHSAPAIVHEITRQGQTDLTLFTDSDSGLMMPLVGLGRVKKVIAAYCGGANQGTNYVIRRAVEQGIPRKVEFQEFSNYGIALMALASAMNVPFLPTHSMIGSSIAENNPDVKIIDDPYCGKPIALVPALRADVCFIHVHRADRLGNLQFYGHFGNTDIFLRSAKYVIATCEELITTDEIRRTPNQTMIPQYNVDAVVEAPFGAHWFASNYYYHNDFPFGSYSLAQWKTHDGFLAWCDKYIFGVEDWDGYCRTVGYERLWKLFHAERRFQAYGEVR